MWSRFLNFELCDDINDQLVRERIKSAIQRIPHRLLILAFPSRLWAPILNYATSLRVRERIDRERATELAILEWVVSLSGSNKKHVSRGKSCGRLELESRLNQKTSERSLLV